jgi:hypothetical protein
MSLSCWNPSSSFLLVNSPSSIRPRQFALVNSPSLIQNWKDSQPEGFTKLNIHKIKKIARLSVAIGAI